MSERDRRPDPDDLPRRALLYAGGLLDARQAREFEAVLAVSQLARETLAAAVAQTLGPDAARPSPAYRARVRRAARGRAPARAGVPRGRPLLWGLTAVAAAVLVCVGLTDRPEPPIPAPAAPAPAVTDNQNCAAADDDCPDTPAAVKPAPPGAEGLQQVRAEESQRHRLENCLRRLHELDRERKGLIPLSDARN